MRGLLLLFLSCLALFGAACGSDDDSGSTSTGASTSAATTAEPEPEAETETTEAGCTPVEAATPKQVDVAKPTERLDPGTTYVVTLTTNCGDIAIELDQQESPKTAASFAHLAEEQVFDGTPFHRIVPGFVIQGGDPAANGTGGPGYGVVEAPPRNEDYPTGTVAMAKGEVDPTGASGSQFFIVLEGGSAALQPLYATAGEVVEGMDVVDRIAAIPTDELSMPLEPVVIESATVEER